MATNNAQQTNKKAGAILSVAETKALFVKEGILPKYTDNSHYVGCGTRANVFSVNSLKKQYNVYCGNDIFELFTPEDYTDCEFTKDGNKVDKTRPNLIVVKSTDSLKKLLGVVLKTHAEFSLDK